MPLTFPAIVRRAEISPCSTYRYTLSRTWDRTLPRLCFVMLNPSTADHLRDDPTVQKCMAIAHHQGFGGIDVVNVFAYRSSSPMMLATASDPTGPDNDRHVQSALNGAARVVIAWGAHTLPKERVLAVITMVQQAGHDLECLRLTKDGHPSHPLARGKGFIPVNTALQPFLFNV